MGEKLTEIHGQRKRKTGRQVNTEEEREKHMLRQRKRKVCRDKGKEIHKHTKEQRYLNIQR